MITVINESKALIKHISCNCRQNFDGRKCKSKRKRNNDKCQYECKDPISHHDSKDDYDCNTDACAIFVEMSQTFPVIAPETLLVDSINRKVAYEINYCIISTIISVIMRFLFLTVIAINCY